MAPAYKLTYFDGRGLGETIRYLFKYGGIEFEDIRIKKENWPQIKDSTPWGQLPILEFNGKQYGQSIAIARYVANLVKLAGNNPEENLEVDAVVDTANDLRLKVSAFFYEQDEAKKKAIIETALNESFPFYLSRLEALAQKNSGYVALGRLTWADLYLTNITHILDLITKTDVLADYPNLKALRERVNALPAIKAWIEARPQTEF